MTDAESAPRRPMLFTPGAAGRLAGEVLTLDEDESRHIRALRLAPGTPIRLTDGAGAIWDAHLGSSSGRTSECVLGLRSTPVEPLPVELAFGVGNKAHVMWLVEKATEMGVSRLVPVESERTRSVADAGRSPAFWNKAVRRAVSAMKQSGGAWLPRIEAPLSLDHYLACCSGSGEDAEEGPTLLVRLDPAGRPLARVLEPWDAVRPIGMLVGPEGGWSPDEATRLDEAGFVAGGLARLVLRFETAAIAGLSVATQRILTRRDSGGGLTSEAEGG